jgi:hypothetical protein
MYYVYKEVKKMETLKFEIRIAKQDLIILEDVIRETEEKQEDCRFLRGKRSGLQHQIYVLEKILKTMEV